MDNIKQSISHFILGLHTQKNLPTWTLANENLIYSLALGEQPQWGQKAKILRKIIVFAQKLAITDFVIFFVGLIRALKFWFSIRKKTIRHRAFPQYEIIFAGFGASSEQYLYEDYVKKHKKSILRINWITGEGLEKLGCPSLLLIIKTIFRNSYGYTQKLKRSIHEVADHWDHFLISCALNIGLYSFFRSIWKKAKIHGVKEIVFLATDISSFAAVDEEIKTTYLQHGLMALTILFPHVNYIENIITLDEEIYLRTILPNTQIKKKVSIPKNPDIKNNNLILLSPNILKETHLILAESLVSWALKLGLNVIIRPTQTVSLKQLRLIEQQFPQTILDDYSQPYENSLKKWNPKFVVSDWSTGLATALDFGSLPISLYDVILNEYRWNNMIYPMKNRVLLWPDDIAIIEKTFYSCDDFF